MHHLRTRRFSGLAAAVIAGGLLLVPTAAFAQAEPDCSTASPSNVDCGGTDTPRDPGTQVGGEQVQRSSGGLPVTGGDAAALAAIGAAVALVGGGFVVAARRRSTTTA